MRGLPAVNEGLGPLLHTQRTAASARPWARASPARKCFNREVHSYAGEAGQCGVGIWVLGGNLCPQALFMKPSAADPALFTDRGARGGSTRSRTSGPASMTRVPVDEKSVLVLKGCARADIPACPSGPICHCRANSGCAGVKDMLRISGRAHERHGLRATVVLHWRRSPTPVGRCPGAGGR